MWKLCLLPRRFSAVVMRFSHIACDTFAVPRQNRVILRGGWRKNNVFQNRTEQTKNQLFPENHEDLWSHENLSVRLRLGHRYKVDLWFTVNRPTLFRTMGLVHSLFSLGTRRPHYEFLFYCVMGKGRLACGIVSPEISNNKNASLV